MNENLSEPAKWRYPLLFALVSIFLLALLSVSQKSEAVDCSPAPNKSFAGCDLTNVDFHGADLTNSTFSNVSLAGADLSGANLTHAYFNKSSLENANLSGVNLTIATFVNTSFLGVESGGIIGSPDALPANWKLVCGYLVGPSANLASADFSNCDLTGANLSGANLSNAILTGVTSSQVLGPMSLPAGWFLVAGHLQQSIFSGSMGIVGTVKVDQTVQADPGQYAMNADLRFQWILDGQPISGETASSLQIRPEMGSKKLSLAVTYLYFGYSLTRTSTDYDVAISRITSASIPTISGSFIVGKIITAAPGTWDLRVNLTYQWLRDGSQIQGESAPTYAIKPADTGALISVVVSGYLVGYQVPAFESIRHRINPATTNATSTPSLVGNCQMGSRLALTAVSWTPSVESKYEWLRNGSIIPNAVSGEYVLTSEDVGNLIEAVIYVDQLGFVPASIQSNECRVLPAALPDQGSVETTGIGQVDQPLFVRTANWAEGVVFEYQWLKDGEAIAGATESQYTPKASDYNHGISIRVTGMKTGFIDRTSTSAPNVIGLGTISPDSRPTISGTFRPGEILRATLGVWRIPVTASFQWLRDGNPIESANKNYYMPTFDDRNHSISVRVTAESFGYLNSTAESESHLVQLPDLLFVGTPFIPASIQVGALVSVNLGNWGQDSNVLFQWMRDGSPISNANGRSYLVSSQDFGRNISVSVAATKSGFNTATTLTNSVKVGAGVLSKPTISLLGTSQVGKNLLARVSGITQPISLSCVWFLDTKALSNKTCSLRLLKSYLNHIVHVRVTVTSHGYLQTAANSKTLKVSR